MGPGRMLLLTLIPALLRGGELRFYYAMRLPIQ
jgi:hypothetical protein